MRDSLDFIPENVSSLCTEKQKWRNKGIFQQEENERQNQAASDAGNYEKECDPPTPKHNLLLNKLASDDVV